MKSVKLILATTALCGILTGCDTDKEKVEATVSEYGTQVEDIEGTVVAKRSTDKSLDDNKDAPKTNESKQAEDKKTDEVKN